MINEMYANAFCKEDISKIENYEQAKNDNTQSWDCHHRTEIWWNCTSQELIDNECYYHRPAKELIFLTHVEHSKLHNNLVKYVQSSDSWIKSKEGRAQVSNLMSNSRWYNNGEINIRIAKDSEPPKGFVLGRTYNKRQRNRG